MTIIASIINIISIINEHGPLDVVVARQFRRKQTR